MGAHTAAHLAANAKPNCVYRYYDHAGRLIYVGITARGQRRQDEHNATSEFFRHVTDQQVEQCHSRDEALRLERELIKVYRPPFNKTHNEDWEALRGAYLAIVAAEEAYAAIRAGDGAHSLQCGHCENCMPFGKGGPCLLPTLSLIPSGDGDYCPTCGSCGCLYGIGWHDGAKAVESMPPCKAEKIGCIPGSSDCIVGHFAQTADYCGNPQCQPCHADAHSYHEGWNSGYEHGRQRLPQHLFRDVHMGSAPVAAAASGVYEAAVIYIEAMTKQGEGEGFRVDLQPYFFDMGAEYRAHVLDGISPEGGAG